MAVCLLCFTAARLFAECEPPGAEPLGRVGVGRAAEAFGADTLVNGLGETGVFDETGAFAWVVG